MPLPNINSEIHELREVEGVICEIFKQCDKIKADIIDFSPDPNGELKFLKDQVVELGIMHSEINALSSVADHIDIMVNEHLEKDDDDRDSRELIKNFESNLSTSRKEQFSDEAQELLTSIENYFKDGAPDGHALESDEELQVTQEKQSYIDLFTKKRMVDPVKSKICNHVFERSSMLSYLHQGSKKCPYFGCASILNRTDLVDDNELKNKLESTA